MKRYIATVEETEEGDAIIPLPEEMLSELNWGEGDVLNWKDNGDGSYTLSKKEKEEKTEWVLVETVSQYRMRYMVEVPAGKAEYALDTVVMEEAVEFSQKHIGETIFSHRVISEEDALKMFDEDNDYLAGWEKDKKIDVAFTKIEDLPK